MGKKLTKKQKKTNEKIIILKLILSIIYLIVIMILALCSYKIFKEEEIETKWSEVENSNQYSYIYISKMSEKFAYDPTTKKSYHFIIETEETGIWHTYIIAINENDYNKYKKIIDYTYERTSEQPEKIKVNGYPALIDNKLKELAIKNIPNFVPAENEIVISNDNFENYLTNSYIDTTIKKKDEFNYVLFTLLLITVIVITLFIATITIKDNTLRKITKTKKINKKEKNKQNKKEEELEII